MELIRLLEELVNIPSISGNEREVADYLYTLLKDIGFEVEKQPAGKAYNLIAKKGNPRLILTAHMDTVPEYIPFTEKGDVLFGRGTCDTKGSIASMLIASDQLFDKTENFGLVFTVQEETDLAGAEKAQQYLKPKYFVVGEPTGNKCVFGQKGVLEAKLKFRGKAAHSSLPELGESAIDKLLLALNKLNQLKLEESESMNIGIIKGGVASNVIPPNAEAELLFRTTKNNKRIIDFLKTISEDLKVTANYEAIKMPMFEICKNSEQFYPAFTELSIWSRSGEGLIYGPGYLKHAHTPKEHVKKQDLVQAVADYKRLINYFSTKP